MIYVSRAFVLMHKSPMGLGRTQKRHRFPLLPSHSSLSKRSTLQPLRSQALRLEIPTSTPLLLPRKLMRLTRKTFLLLPETLKRLILMMKTIILAETLPLRPLILTKTRSLYLIPKTSLPPLILKMTPSLIRMRTRSPLLERI